MIVGLGIDVIEVSRIKRAMANPRFLARILTPAELRLDLTPQRVAGRWAAKEAIAKALGLRLTWQDVEILPDEEGAPVVRISAADFRPSEVRLRVSISHERGIAAAVAILESV